MNTNTFSKLTLGTLALIALGALPALADAGSGLATGKRQHTPAAAATAQDDASTADADSDGRAEGVKSPRDAASGQATGKRAHKPMTTSSPDLDSDNDGVDAQGMAINEKGMPGNTTKAKAGKTGATK